MPRKRQNTKTKYSSVSETAMFLASDGHWGSYDAASWDAWTYKYPTVKRSECASVWGIVWPSLELEWSESYPGRRPAWWWIFDAPPMSAAEIAAMGWEDCDFAEHLREPRRRLGGVGDPKFEHLNYVPSWDYGIPSSWVSEWE